MIRNSPHGVKIIYSLCFDSDTIAVRSEANATPRAIGGLAGGNSGAEDGAKLGRAVSNLGGGKHVGIKSGILL